MVLFKFEMVYVVLPPCVGCESVCDDVLKYMYICWICTSYIYVCYDVCIYMYLLCIYVYAMYCRDKVVYNGLTLRPLLVSTTLLDTEHCVHSLQVMRTQLETLGEEFKLASWEISDGENLLCFEFGL